MKAHWRKILAYLPQQLERNYYKKFFLKEHRQWDKQAPASNYSKQEALKEFQQKFSLKTLVETGTYLGDTLYALAHDFEDLYSIELSEHYYTLAKKRFTNFSNITLLQGNSGQVLKELVPQLKNPVLFWLDGHYSGGLTAKGDKECPVYEELNAIFSSSYNHVIFIDDARLFTGKNDYPSINDLQTFVKSIKPQYHFVIENDCIRLFP